ncbi:hypothetical protein [Leptolyngbya ohadii]|uniref:hypothetical protein n=1 Tax=Leptolyngbya ohadii TaxID=1962290 RepID=UPI000B59E96E|nr:hypothetical protein [Leptolyngbya ohadii]
MAFWEFLLQKDGDRSWLPLESPTVEILEGRYRVVGRSSRINTPVEIRIAHTALADSVPMRRSQKRVGCTNQDGLVVIMPFTQLHPGDWELYCIGDLMADMMGDGWQYGVKLEVLPAVQDAEIWDSDLDGSAEFATDSSPVQVVPAAETIAETHAEIYAETIPEADSETRADLIPASPEVVAAEVVEMPAADESLSSPSEIDSSEADQPTINQHPYASQFPEGVIVPAPFALPFTLPPLSLRLEQEMYIVRRGEPLIVKGEIRSDLPDSEELLLQVRVRLYAPQNAQVLMEQVYLLTPAAPPIPFTCAAPLPQHYETYLMLGEVIVEIADDRAESNVIVKVASQSFKVTTDLHELLESLANSFSELPDVMPPLEAVSLPSESPGFAQSNAVPMVQFQPAQTVLPPQLRSVPSEGEGSADAQKERRIELPTFSQASSTQDTNTDSATPQDQPESAEMTVGRAIDLLNEGNPPEIGIAQRGVEDGTAASVISKAAEAAAIAESPSASGVRLPGGAVTPSQLSQPIVSDTDPELDWQHADLPKSSKPTPDKPLAPEDIAFRSLNLQQRFLSRLQSLASDNKLSAVLQSQQTPVSPSEPTEEAPIVSVFDRTQEPIGEDAHLAQDEFVIDEGWEEMAAMQQQSAPRKPWLSAPEPPRTPGSTLSPDEPLPVPSLHLSDDNWVSGNSVSVLVKLPDSPAKMAVKLWLIDRQSRLLLDGPHWLTDFAPDGFGQWMSRIDLFLPQGYLDVQIEAISVEIMTQRESNKTTEARSIDLSLSEYTFDSIDV